MPAKARSLAAAAILSIAMAVSVATLASAQSGVTAGILHCDVAGNSSLVFGSSRDIACIYDVGGGKPIDRYTGIVKKYGIDIGYETHGLLIWGVIASGGYVGPGALAGRYGGVTSAVALGIGVGSNVLFGGSRNNIALQPLSVEGMQGVNIAAGIGVLTLVHAR